jgi:hypothetical protein
MQTNDHNEKVKIIKKLLKSGKWDYNLYSVGKKLSEIKDKETRERLIISLAERPPRDLQLEFIKYYSS